MPFINSISNAFYAWERDTPQNKADTVVKSAVGSFVISHLTKDVYASLFSAGVAATASFIHALLTPIFKKFFKEKYLPIHQSIALVTVNLAVTQVVVNSFVSAYKRVDFISNIVLIVLPIISMNFVKWEHHHLEDNWLYIFFK